MWNVKDTSDVIISRGNWNNLKVIQERLERHTGKAQNQGMTENIHIWSCKHTAESADVKVQDI
jgi:hypothetical protein